MSRFFWNFVPLFDSGRLVGMAVSVDITTLVVAIHAVTYIEFCIMTVNDYIIIIITYITLLICFTTFLS